MLLYHELYSKVNLRVHFLLSVLSFGVHWLKIRSIFKKGAKMTRNQAYLTPPRLLFKMGILLAILQMAAFASGASASTNVFQEDFTTTEYQDVLNTTAHWNTSVGELNLRPFEFTLAGGFDTPGKAFNVAISGDFAFVADRSSGLQVIDISDPTQPILVGSYDTPGEAHCVAISGDFAFVADFNSGLLVLDISDPIFPTLAGSYSTSSFANGITVSGDHAFLATDTAGLLVLNISDPNQPTFAGICDTPDKAINVTVAGNYAYVADYNSGLQVINISDPSDPTIAGSYDTPSRAYGITVSGNNAFVSDWDSGLQVINISDPMHPTLAGTFGPMSLTLNVAISGDRAFVADYNSGLRVIDISDPTQPTLVASFLTPGAEARGIAVSGDQVFVADGDFGLQVINISEPTSPAFVGSAGTVSGATGIDISGNHAFVTEYHSGLQVIDISDPTNPSNSGIYNTPGEARGVAVSGDYAFVADGASGLQVIDISVPNIPTLAGSYSTPGGSWGVAVAGNHAFVADNSSLLVIDITDPAHPTLSGSWETLGNSYGVAVSGDYAFVADGTSGLQVVDISNPANPTLAGSYDTPGAAHNVAISGNHAYLSDMSSGLQVIDITDPENPSFAGSFDTPGDARSTVISGNYAFVADEEFGLQVIDISDPEHPTFAGNFDISGVAYAISISGENTYVADLSGGLEVIKVFQSEFDGSNNRGQSLFVDTPEKSIRKFRLTTTQTENVDWELSADGTVNWQEILPDGTWNQVAVTGSDLVWRSTHFWAADGVNPGVTQLEIGWLYDSVSIKSIVDVPGDQGGWVRAYFSRSALDFTDEISLPISSYGIWRLVEDLAFLADLEAQPSSRTEKKSHGTSPDMGDVPLILYEGRTYFQSLPDVKASSFPAGTWESVSTVPAVQQDQYIAVIPTVADSSSSGTNPVTLVITAHTTTPSIWYASEPASGHSVDNLAPAMVKGLAGTVLYGPMSINLNWQPNAEYDMAHYNIYRGSSPGFTPDQTSWVATVTDTMYLDTAGTSSDFYRLSAVDLHGNEGLSALLSPNDISSVGDSTPHPVFAIERIYPNPFNPRTKIAFTVATVGPVRLDIHDLTGRRIRTLLNETREPGSYTATWAGNDDHGHPVSSGTYLCRLTTATGTISRSMVLIK